jgi:hypothetical protein
LLGCFVEHFTNAAALVTPYARNTTEHRYIYSIVVRDPQEGSLLGKSYSNDASIDGQVATPRTTPMSDDKAFDYYPQTELITATAIPTLATAATTMPPIDDRTPDAQVVAAPSSLSPKLGTDRFLTALHNFEPSSSIPLRRSRSDVGPILA